MESLLQVASGSLKFGVSVTKGKKERVDTGTANHSCVLSCRISTIRTKICVTPGCTAQTSTLAGSQSLAFEKLPGMYFLSEFNS